METKNAHHFFGIIRTTDTSNVSHAAALDAVTAAYPGAFRGGQAKVTPELDLLGQVHHANIPGRVDLYFFGELYPAHSMGNLSQKVDELLRRIQAVGLHEAVAALNGRFCVCYLDHTRREAHLLSDQMGIQQVFYHRGEGFLVFASELKFLVKHPLCPREIDWRNALRRSLPFEVLDGEVNYHAWFKEVYLLEEATDLTLDTHTGAIAKSTYWDPYSQPPEASHRTALQVMDAYMDLLQDAVRIRISGEGPAYSLLSGGLDSSILCALAAREKPLETFSVITQTTTLEGTSEMCFRLSQEKAFRNTQFVVPMHRLSGDPMLWKQRIWHAESPINHNDSMVKTLLHYAIRRHRTELDYTLTGTGSDQLNGGLARWIVNDADNPEDNWTNMIGRIAEAELRQHLPERWFALWGARRFLNRDFIQQISGRPLESNPWMYYVKCNLHINRYVLLWDENRAASAHRHSVRYPFLDHRFLPFIAGVPEHLHGELYYDKQILRVPATRYLPDYILNKPKAPADTGIYDHRFSDYHQLVGPGRLELFEEALGPLHEPHPAIDKKAWIKELERLYHQPDHIAWQYLLNVVNLGFLEKLHLQDENTINYEGALEAHIDTVHTLHPEDVTRVRKNLDILSEDEVFNKPLVFAPGCSLVVEHGTGKLFLNNNESLVYELDPEEETWHKFLLAVDGQHSASEILSSIDGEATEISEYLFLCLKEQILKIA